MALLATTLRVRATGLAVALVPVKSNVVKLPRVAGLLFVAVQAKLMPACALIAPCRGSPAVTLALSASVAASASVMTTVGAVGRGETCRVRVPGVAVQPTS